MSNKNKNKLPRNPFVEEFAKGRYKGGRHKNKRRRGKGNRKQQQDKAIKDYL